MSWEVGQIPRLIEPICTRENVTKDIGVGRGCLTNAR